MIGIAMSAGFKAGQGAQARSIGWEMERTPTLAAEAGGNSVPSVCVVYDARGNGDGKIVPTLTGDHESRVTDYTAVTVEAVCCLDGDKIGKAECAGGSGLGIRDGNICSQRKTWERLKAIEDNLGNEYDLDRLRELVEADREGRCFITPFVAMVEQSLMNGEMKPNKDQRFNGRYAVRFTLMPQPHFVLQSVRIKRYNRTGKVDSI